MKIIADLFQMERPCLKMSLFKNDVSIVLVNVTTGEHYDVPVGVGWDLVQGELS